MRTKTVLLATALLALMPVPVLAGPQVGDPAPDFAIPDTNYSSVHLSDFSGKVVQLFFWESTSPTCLEELPRIQVLYDEYKGRGFVPLAINLQDMDVVKNYARTPYAFPMLLDDAGVWNLYNISGVLPLNYVIDPDGIVQYGVEEWQESTIRTCIETYLGVAEGKAEPMLKILSATPSPATGPTTIRYSLRKAGDVSLRVYSSSGKLVATLLDGAQSAGDHRTRWNLRDDAGNSVANGTYVYVLRSGNACESGKVTVLR